MAAPAPFSYANIHEKKQDDKSLRLVTLEGSALLKIVKHCQESQPSLVTGQLLGLSVGTSLEVTDCYPFPVRRRATSATTRTKQLAGFLDGSSSSSCAELQQTRRRGG